MDKMRVLWFSPTPCGSVKRNNQDTILGGWLISLEEELKKHDDIELSVAYFSDKKEKEFVYEGVRYYPMERGKNSFFLKRIRERGKKIEKTDKIRLQEMLKVVKKSQPDLIHIHGSEECFILISSYVENIPVVVSIQGMIAPICEKFFSGVSQSDAFKVDTIKDRVLLTGIRQYWKSFRERGIRECNCLPQIQYIMGRTFWDENCTLALNPHRKYFVVNEILRLPFYKHQWKGHLSTEKINIISTISGGIYKGIETALKTSSLLKKYTRFDFEWHIAGCDSKSKWIRIAETITKLKTSDCNMILHGRVDAEELSNLLCSSDIYVNVSHIENSSNSVCEAMLVGMPVIASYAGGTASLLTHKEEGILVQDGDPYVLAGAIYSMTLSLDKTRELGTRARTRALQRHNPEKVYQELLNSYQKIVADYYHLSFDGTK